MSSVRGKVGSWDIEWVTVPHGPSGMAHAVVRASPQDLGTQIEVRWRRDPDGIWIELPNSVHGFDLDAAASDSGSLVYQISERGTDRHWQGASFVRAGEESLAAAESGRKRSVRVRAQMPGKIVRVLVKAGQSVAKDQPLLVMEAMKMENEIRAAAPGVIQTIKIVEGQAVETGADLLVLE